MKSWYSAAELAGLPGMPKNIRAIYFRARREGWKFKFEAVQRKAAPKGTRK